MPTIIDCGPMNSSPSKKKKEERKKNCTGDNDESKMFRRRKCAFHSNGLLLKVVHSVFSTA